MILLLPLRGQMFYIRMFGHLWAKKNKKQPEAEMGGLDGSDTVPSIYKEGEADETVLKLAGVYK